MIPELRTNLHNVLKLTTGLDDSNVWMGRAPSPGKQSEQVDPVCTFNLIVDNMFRDTGSQFEENFIQITFGSTDYAAIEAMSEEAKLLLDDRSNYSFAAYNLQNVKRGS